MSDRNSTVNLTPGQADAGRTIMRQGRKAYTREEVRELAGRKGTTERARQIANALERDREKPLQTHHSRAKPDQAADEQPPEPRQPAPDEQAESREDPTPEPTDESQDSDHTSGDDDAVTFESLSDLAAHLDLDEAALRGLKTKIKVDGEESEMTLEEVIKGTQLARSNTQKRQQLAARERQLEAEREQQVQDIQAQLKQAQSAHVAAAHVMQQELQQPGIQQLRQTDPAAFLQWQELANARVQQLQQAHQQLLQHEQALVQRETQRRQEAGLRRLREEIPDLETPERYNAIASVFEEFGASKQDMQSILDERIILLANRYAEMKQELEAIRKREEEATRRAKKVAAQSQSAGSKPRGKANAASKKRVEEAKKAIHGKRGHARTRAAENAIFTALQESRRRR